MIPTKKSLGVVSTLLKSLIVSPNPRPSIISASAIGAILVTIIYDQTKDDYFYQPLIFGIIMVLLVVFMPRGIGGLLERTLVKRKFIKKHEDKVIDIA